PTPRKSRADQAGGGARTAHHRRPASNEEPKMNLHRIVLPSLAAVACALPARAADAPATAPLVEAAALQWGDAPPSLPKGAKLAVLQGDPGKPGPFTLRLKTPANYKIPPHT